MTIVTCPHCNAEIDCTADALFVTAECPNCGGSFMPADYIKRQPQEVQMANATTTSTSELVSIAKSLKRIEKSVQQLAASQILTEEWSNSVKKNVQVVGGLATLSIILIVGMMLLYFLKLIISEPEVAFTRFMAFCCIAGFVGIGFALYRKLVRSNVKCN
jgi:hypothetical protein